MLAFARALCDRDWDTARECFAPDLVLVDHRPLSLGALDREQWIASLRANDDLSVGLTWDVFRVLAWSEQGFVVGIRRLGTIADGGGPFENEALHDGARRGWADPTLRVLRRTRRRVRRGALRGAVRAALAT